MRTWVGWIIGATREELAEMGIEVTGEDVREGAGELVVRMNDESLRKLQPHWGRYFWGLTSSGASPWMHPSMTALSRPHEPGDPERQWICYDCGQTGTIDELRKKHCTAILPPCKACGMTPECELDCAGIAAALGAHGVEVIGMDKPKLPEA